MFSLQVVISNYQIKEIYVLIKVLGYNCLGTVFILPPAPNGVVAPFWLLTNMLVPAHKSRQFSGAGRISLFPASSNFRLFFLKF
jgi:acetylglutamate synthase